MRLAGQILVHDFARQLLGPGFELRLGAFVLIFVVHDRLGDAAVGGLGGGHFGAPNQGHYPLVAHLGDLLVELLDAFVLGLGHVQGFEVGEDFLVLAGLHLEPFGALVLEGPLEQGQLLGDVGRAGGDV